MNKEILRLAIPNIISNISIPLLSTVDTALMGRLSALHIGAVGLGAMIFNFIFWNFGFLRMGTTGITAQAFGQQNNPRIIQSLLRAMIIGLAIAIVLLLLQRWIGTVGFQLLNVQAEQLPLVQTYFYTRIWAAPASLSLFALMGWFFGMQNAVFPLVITIVVNMVNIVLNFLLVYRFGMDVDGVALSTVIAQYVGLTLGVGLLIWKYRYLFHSIQRQVLMAVEELQAFWQVNSDIFIRTICLTLAFTIFYSQSSDASELILATNVILLQFVNWMSYGIDGFAFAAESLVGKYYGAKQKSQTHRAIRHAFGWGIALAALFALIYLIFGQSLLYVFTDQVSVIEAALPYLVWIIIFPIVGTPCYIWDGVFIGLTASKAMRNSMLLAFAIFLLATFGLKQPLGNHGLWLALTLFMLARGGIQQLLFWRKRVQLV